MSSTGSSTRIPGWTLQQVVRAAGEKSGSESGPSVHHRRGRSKTYYHQSSREDKSETLGVACSGRTPASGGVFRNRCRHQENARRSSAPLPCAATPSGRIPASATSLPSAPTPARLGAAAVGRSFEILEVKSRLWGDWFTVKHRACKMMMLSVHRETPDGDRTSAPLVHGETLGIESTKIRLVHGETREWNRAHGPAGSP